MGVKVELLECPIVSGNFSANFEIKRNRCCNVYIFNQNDFLVIGYTSNDIQSGHLYYLYKI